MKKIIACLVVSIVLGCSDPKSVVIPEYNHDRQHKKEFVRAMKNLSDHDRAMVNGYIGMAEIHGEDMGGATIGQAIEVMEKMNFGKL